MASSERDVREQNGGQTIDSACVADYHEHCACPKTCECECHKMSPNDEREELVNYGEFMRAMHGEAPNDEARQHFKEQAEYAEKRLQRLDGRGLDECYHKALNLLERAVATEMSAPDKTWFQEYFALTGEHMILTEEGWTTGKDKPAYSADEILDEVNAPCEQQS